MVSAAAAVVLLGVLEGGAVAAPAKPTTHTLVIEASHFEPEVLTVRIGDRITWVNKDPFPHTATSMGNFDSTAIQPDQSWTFTPTVKGELAYICSFHPTMKGTLRVK
jgi:plastocyanin